MTVQKLCDELTILSHSHGLAQKEVRCLVKEGCDECEIKDVIWMPDGYILLVDQAIKPDFK